MNVKTIRQNMTEAALSIETVMRGHPRISLKELSAACGLNQTSTEFIVEQMVYFGVVHRGAFGRYSLTSSYKDGRF
ncbi:TPA: hypothetical protein ACOEHG_004916 [Enterobacter ludwigii]